MFFVSILAGVRIARDSLADRAPLYFQKNAENLEEALKIEQANSHFKVSGGLLEQLMTAYKDLFIFNVFGHPSELESFFESMDFDDDLLVLRSRILPQDQLNFQVGLKSLLDPFPIEIRSIFEKTYFNEANLWHWQESARTGKWSDQALGTTLPTNTFERLESGQLPGESLLSSLGFFQMELGGADFESDGWVIVGTPSGAFVLTNGLLLFAGDYGNAALGTDSLFDLVSLFSKHASAKGARVLFSNRRMEHGSNSFGITADLMDVSKIPLVDESDFSSDMLPHIGFEHGIICNAANAPFHNILAANPNSDFWRLLCLGEFLQNSGFNTHVAWHESSYFFSEEAPSISVYLDNPHDLYSSAQGNFYTKELTVEAQGEALTFAIKALENFGFSTKDS